MRVFLLPIMSQYLVKNIGLNRPPSDDNPAIKAISIVPAGSPNGFMSVSLDFSFHITGEVHTVLTPTPTMMRQAEMRKVYYQ